MSEGFALFRGVKKEVQHESATCSPSVSLLFVPLVLALEESGGAMCVVGGGLEGARC